MHCLTLFSPSYDLHTFIREILRHVHKRKLNSIFYLCKYVMEETLIFILYNLYKCHIFQAYYVRKIVLLNKKNCFMFR